MKKSILFAAAGLVAGMALVTDARAEEKGWEWSPAGIGIAAPAQIPWMSTDVYGLRFGGLFGYNPCVKGLDIGVANVVRDRFVGLGLGAFSFVGDSGSFAFRVSALANVTTGKSYDLSFAPFVIQRDDAYGLSVGALNWAQAFSGVRVACLMNWTVGVSQGLEIAPVNAGNDDFTGLQVAGMNYTSRMTGCQLGVFNYVDGVASGCQIGLINAAENMTGVQIGLVNIISKSSFPIMTIANANF